MYITPACDDLNSNRLHSLNYLNSWSTIRGTICKDLEGVALLVGVATACSFGFSIPELGTVVPHGLFPVYFSVFINFILVQLLNRQACW